MFKFKYKDIDFSHKLDRASSPQDEYWKHMHPFNEIVFFVKGAAEYTVEAQTQKLQKGSLVFIRSGKFHFATVDKGQDYERYVLKFPDSAIPPYLKEKFDEISPFFTSGYAYDYLFDELDSDFELMNVSEEDIRTLFLCILVKLLVILSHQQEKAEFDTDPVSNQILLYVNQHIKDDLSLSSIATALNYSQSYLANLFKKKMHSSLMQYIRYRKCILAYKMISAGEKPQTVASNLGFKEYSTFFRAYKNIIGVAPSDTEKANPVDLKER